MEVKKDILTIEEQQAKLLKKMRRMDMIRTLACVLVAVVAVGMDRYCRPEQPRKALSPM